MQKEGIALRGLFIIDPNGVVQQVATLQNRTALHSLQIVDFHQITINNLPVGRSVEETLRLIQAFQFVEKYGEVCPANWKPGDVAMKAGPEDSQVSSKHQSLPTT